MLIKIEHNQFSSEYDQQLEVWAEVVKERREVWVNPDAITSIGFSHDRPGFARIMCYGLSGALSWTVSEIEARALIARINDTSTPIQRAVDELLADEIMKANAHFAKPDADIG